MFLIALVGWTAVAMSLRPELFKAVRTSDPRGSLCEVGTEYPENLSCSLPYDVAEEEVNGSDLRPRLSLWFDRIEFGRRKL